MTPKNAVDRIEALLVALGKMPQNDYIEALEEMEDRARSAREAFLEDLEREPAIGED